MRDGTFATRVLHSWIVWQAAQRPLTCALPALPAATLFRGRFGRLLASVSRPRDHGLSACFRARGMAHASPTRHTRVEAVVVPPPTCEDLILYIERESVLLLSWILPSQNAARLNAHHYALKQASSTTPLAQLDP